MIEYKTGNILTEDAEAIVNTINCVGVMGRGIALQFKKRYPENFKKYAAACRNKEVVLGKMFVFKTEASTYPKYIINFPTKNHWRGKSKAEDIARGLDDLLGVILKKEIKSIALPPLGCGLGGLEWKKVKDIIEEKLSKFTDIKIVVFEPQTTPQIHRIVKTENIPSMTPGRAALINLMHGYLESLLDPSITLLEIHKLMYFMQETGEKLKLQYSKKYYGPYGKNLKHVLNAIEGHFISGYGDGGDMPEKQLELLSGAYEKAQSVLTENMNTKLNVQKVMDLVDGFETPFGLELLSSVHWLIDKEDATSKQEVIESLHGWTSKKRQFSDHQVGIAIDILMGKKWIKKNFQVSK